MKILLFSIMALVGVLLVGLQHHQLGELRAENSALTQASAEASRLRHDLAATTGNAVQDDAELERLRQENSDLLKLRNEINQLRNTRAEFDKVNAENQRLQVLARTAAKSAEKNSAMRPIVVPIAELSNRGLATPEDALFTYFWAEREDNLEVLLQCRTPNHAAETGRYFHMDSEQFSHLASIEIAARHNTVDSTTIQLGLRMHSKNGTTVDQMTVVQLILIGAEWKLDVNDFL